jgi:hypothetical protein
VPLVAAPSTTGPLPEKAHRLLVVLRELFDTKGATLTEWVKNSGVPGKRNSEMSETTVRRLRGDLLDRKLIEQEGSSRGARYQLTPAGRDAASLPPNRRGGSGTAEVAESRPKPLPSAARWWRNFAQEPQGESDSRHKPPQATMAAAVSSAATGAPLKGAPRWRERSDDTDPVEEGTL